MSVKFKVEHGSTVKPDSFQQIDRRLTQFWGKPLSPTDLKICEALGWAELEPSGPIWNLTEYARAFEGPIYQDDGLREHTWDIVLQEYLEHRQLACLDRYMGKGSGRRMELRTLLTLISLVLQGHAEFIDHGDILAFSAVTDLPSANDKTSDVDEAIEEIVKKRTACLVMGDDGKEMLSVTPRGLFRRLSVSNADELGLGEIVAELEKRGLMCRRKVNGEIAWRPTRMGRRAGLDAVDIPFVWLLEKLGLDTFVEKAAADRDRKRQIAGLN
jgi:hypothetical protein